MSNYLLRFLFTNIYSLGTTKKGYSMRERPTEIAKYLTDRRKDLGLTQKEAAKKIGKERSYLCAFERGKRRPPPHILRALAGIYDILPEDLLKKAGLIELPLLDAIRTPDEVSDNILSDTTEEERRELKRYLAFLRLGHPVRH